MRVRQLISVSGSLHRVVHCPHEPHHLYIGGPSKWRSVFPLGRDGTRQQVIRHYARLPAPGPWLLEDLQELQGYRTPAEQLGFAPTDVHQAAIDFHEIIARIDAAHAVT
jgi:hypothetical protein